VLSLPGSLGDTVYSLTLSGLLIFAFVLWLLRGVYRGRLTYRFTGIEVGLALFLVAAVLSAWGASDKRTAITQIVTLLGPICAAALLVQILDRPGAVQVVLAVLVALGLVCAYQCAEQFFVSNAITIEQYEKDPQMLLEPLGIETGTFQHFLFEHRLYSRGIRGFFTTSNSAASFGILACAAAAILLLGRLQDSGRVREKPVPRGMGFQPMKHRQDADATKPHGQDARATLQTRSETPEVAPHYRVFAILAMVLVVVGLFLTQSKGGILAFWAGLAGFGLWAAVDRWFPARKRLILAVLVPLALLLLAGAGCLMVLYGVKHGRLPGGNSMLVRWQYWAASAQMISEHPLTGVGPGNFSDFYTHYKPPAALESVADPHNFLLSLIAQYGPLGLLGFLAMVFLPLGRRIAAPGAEPPQPGPHAQLSSRTPSLAILLAICACLLLIRWLLIPMMGDSPDVLLYEVITVHIAPVAVFLIGFLLVLSPLEDVLGRRSDFASPMASAILVCGLLAVLLHNLIDFALFEPGVWMAFWTVFACLLALRAGPPRDFDIATQDGRLRKPLAAGIAVVLLGAYCFWVWKPACSTALGIHRAQQAASTGNYDAAHHHLEAAMQADRLSAVAANFNGRLHLQQYEQMQPRKTVVLEGAIRCFRAAIERNPADYKNYEKLATAYSLLGQPPQAYDWYLRAAALYPGCERLWFELAQTAEQIGKPGLALCHYAKAVEIEESYRQQFRQMYPDRENVVSRLGDKEYQHARRRMAELSK
jgi:O-antigen ligase/tetratricopeptide (TPR) repeat protein